MAKSPKETAVNAPAENPAPETVEFNPETGEVTQGEIVSNSARALSTVKAPPRFKVKQQVTRPLLKQADGETIFIQALSAPYYGKEITGGKYESIALLLNVKDLASGASGEFQYILNAVLFRYVDAKGKVARVETQADVEKVMAGISTGEFRAAGELFEAYGNDISGRMFSIMKMPKEEGKRYHAFHVAEIELDDSPEAEEA